MINILYFHLSYVHLPTICPPEVMHGQHLGNVSNWLVILFKYWLVYILFYRGILAIILYDRSTGDDVKNLTWFRSLKPEKKKLINAFVMSKEDIEVFNSRVKSILFSKEALRPMGQIEDGKKLKVIEYENLLCYGWGCLESLLHESRVVSISRLAFIMSTLSDRNILKIKVKEEAKRFTREFSPITHPTKGSCWKWTLILSTICAKWSLCMDHWLFSQLITPKTLSVW